MNGPKDYWKIPLSPENRRQLDEDLIRELNEKETAAEEGGDRPGGKRGAIKAVSLVLALVFALLVFGRLLNIFTLPSLDFLQESRRLAQIPQVKELQQAVVSIEADSRRGTGFNIDPTGVIVTNYHVIRESRNIRVSFPGSLPQGGEVMGSIPQLDLAVVSVEGQDLPALGLDADTPLQRGDTVLIIGNPLGLSSVVSEGTVEGFVTLKNWEEQVLMIRGPVHKGSSGSPVFNQEGLVAAVIFATLQREEGGRDDIIGLAVPVDRLTALIPSVP